MSQPAWKSGAPVIAQVDTFTPGGTITTGDVNTLTVKGEGGATIATITFTTAGTTTAAAVSAGLIAAWAANSIAAALATASGTSTAVLTAAVAGVPFHVTSSVTGVGTLSRAATTPNSGPNDWATTANWSTGSVPVSTDTVTIDGRGGSTSANAILYGLQQTGVTLTALRHFKSAPPVGTLSFALAISATTTDLYLPANDGTSPSGSLCSIDTGSNATTMNVNDSPGQGISGLPPVLIAGSHASNVLNLYGRPIVGVGVATPGQSCSFPTITVAGGTLTLGTGTTAPTLLTNNGGKVYMGLGNSSGTVTNNAGECTVSGGTKMSAVNCNGGKVHYNVRISGDDEDTMTMNGGELDLSGAAAAINVGTLAIKKGGIIRLANASQLSATSTTFDATNNVNLQMLLAA